MSNAIVPVKTLSVIEPWASLLIEGLKTFETRSWNTKHRGRLAIHASKRIPPDVRAMIILGEHPTVRALMQRWQLPDGERVLERLMSSCGCVLGTVTLDWTTQARQPPHGPTRHSLILAGCHMHEFDFGDFSAGRWLWKCTNPRHLITPVYATGSRGLWTWELPVGDDTQWRE